MFDGGLRIAVRNGGSEAHESCSEIPDIEDGFMDNIESLRHVLSALENDLRYFRAQVSLIPHGSTNPDDVIAFRIFNGLVRKRRAQIGHVRRELAQFAPSPAQRAASRESSLSARLHSEQRGNRRV